MKRSKPTIMCTTSSRNDSWNVKSPNAVKRMMITVEEALMGVNNILLEVSRDINGLWLCSG